MEGAWNTGAPGDMEGGACLKGKAEGRWMLKVSSEKGIGMAREGKKTRQGPTFSDSIYMDKDNEYGQYRDTRIYL